jgi:nucleoside-diphosphate-sugar epimerase
MRVLLAGSSGVIGSEVRRQLKQAGHSVTGLARTWAPGVDLAVDVLDREAVLAAVDGLRFDAVVQLATAVRERPLHYGHLLYTNRLRTEGTSALLAAARLTHARKVVTTSSFVGYGLSDHGPEPLNEFEAFGVLPDAAQRALLSNEQQVRAFGGVVLRYGIVYGTRAFPVAAGRGERVLPWLHVDDAASAIVTALTRYRAGEIFNIADDTPTSWDDMQQAAAIAHGTRAPLRVPGWMLRASAPFLGELILDTSMVLSTEKARTVLRWRPRYPSVVEGLAAQLAVTSRA